MSKISDRHLFANINPETLWSKIDRHPGLLLPHILQKSAFGIYSESTGEHFGFQLQSPWEALPTGDWKVLAEVKERIPAEKVACHFDASLGHRDLYSGDLTITFEAAENDTVVTLSLDGMRESGLAAYSDELIETILRSLIRESWDAINATIADGLDNEAKQSDGDELFSNHMDPLALAAGVFSAGMALGLWLWRRKRKDENR